MELLLIRHGETESNIKGIIHRVKDPSILTAKGKLQAEAVATLCKRKNIDSLFTSTEERAIQTTQAIADETSLTPVLLDELRERDWGEWAGRPWSEIAEVLNPMTIGERYKFIPPKGESWEQMDARLEQAIERVVKGTRKVGALVLHAGALRALVTLLKNEPKSNSLNYDFDNGSVTIFEYIDGKFKEVTVNNTSHLGDLPND